MPPGRPDHAVLPLMRRQPGSRIEAFAASAGEGMMAVASPRFCGRCGAQLLPGAVFCGKCGAPQQAAAIAAPPVAAPAAYGYRLAPPGAFPRAGRVKLPPLMVVGGLLLILVVAVAV